MRDARAETLHDLKSPVTVLRVYTDLVAESARRGELPGPDHLAGLARELSLMEALVGVPPRAPVPVPAHNGAAAARAWRSPSAVAAGIPGRGIGLGVTKELLEQNGGKISLLSEPGHGLEVTIMFPLVREGRP